MRTVAPSVPFLGLRVETDPGSLDADVAILGTPHGWPYPNPGTAAQCAEAPAAVRERSHRLARFLGHWDFDLEGPLLPPRVADRIVDAGDVPGQPSDGSGNAARIEAMVREVLERGAIPICLGGDDSVPIPILRAWEGRGPITVLQVDAHLDFRDEVRGVREGYSSPMRRASEMPHVSRIVHVGLRGVGSARPSDLDDSVRAGNRIVTARDLHRHGVEPVLAELSPDAAVVLSFDVDGLDPSVAPAVSAPAPGGVTYDHAVDLVRGVGPRLAGAIFTEYVPALDVGERTALVVARLAMIAASVV